MTDMQKSTKKGDFTATVKVNKKFGPRFYRLTLELRGEGAKAFSATKPGQFTELNLSSIAGPPERQIPDDLQDAVKRNVILRRPFSFSDVRIKEDSTLIDIIYCAVGPATLRITTLKPYEKIKILGPLGNGFNIPDNKKNALLIAGGMGSPPIQHLGKALNQTHGEIYTLAFIGAKSKTDLPFEGRLDEVASGIGYPVKAFAQHGIESQIATDDGSAGFNGLVTSCVKEWLDNNEWQSRDVIIFACGPEPMLEAVTKIAAEKNIDCQISMERRMGCGIGLCQSCAVECKAANSDETIYKLCCKDGPIFDANEVVFESKEKHHNL